MMSLRVLTLAAAFAVTACATPVGEDAAGRFDNYDGMTSLTGYDSVYLAPVAVSDAVTARIDARRVGPTTDADERPLSERDIETKRMDLEQEVREALSKVVTLEGAPAEGVLTVEITLTDLRSTRPTLADTRTNPGLSFESVYAGGAAVEIAFTDGGETIATASDERFYDLNEGPKVSIWQDADRYFSLLADKVASLFRSAS